MQLIWKTCVSTSLNWPIKIKLNYQGVKKTGLHQRMNNTFMSNTPQKYMSLQYIPLIIY